MLMMPLIIVLGVRKATEGCHDCRMGTPIWVLTGLVCVCLVQLPPSMYLMNAPCCRSLAWEMRHGLEKAQRVVLGWHSVIDLSLCRHAAKVPIPEPDFDMRPGACWI